MELSELNLAWQQLDRRLAQVERLHHSEYLQRKRQRMRASLRGLYWGQWLQAVLGSATMVYAANFWIAHQSEPMMVLSGIVLQFYGLTLLINAAVVLTRINRLNYAAPVVDLQRRWAELRVAYVRSGMLAGLPWWVIWIPVMAVIFKSLFGVSLYLNAPLSMAVSALFGVAGLVATWFFHRFATSPQRPRLSRWMEAALSGESLRRAKAELESIEDFARDKPIGD